MSICSAPITHTIEFKLREKNDVPILSTAVSSLPRRVSGT